MNNIRKKVNYRIAISTLIIYLFFHLDGLSTRFLENMDRDIRNLRTSYDQNVSELLQKQNDFENFLKMCTDLENDFNQILNSIQMIEKQLNNYCLKSLISDKKNDTKFYQNVSNDVKNTIIDFEKFIDHYNSVNSAQNRRDVLHFNIQQVKSQLKSIESAAYELCKKCENAVLHFQDFDTKQRSFIDSLEKSIQG